jgi:hypothetical protein
MTVKPLRGLPTVAKRTAEITPIAGGLRHENKAVALNFKPEPIVATECGSGWYHDAAIQQLKEIH